MHSYIEWSNAHILLSLYSFLLFSPLFSSSLVFFSFFLSFFLSFVLFFLLLFFFVLLFYSSLIIYPLQTIKIYPFPSLFRLLFIYLFIYLFICLFIYLSPLFSLVISRFRFGKKMGVVRIELTTS